MQAEPDDFQNQLLRGLTHKMNNILSLFGGYVGLLLEGRNLDPQMTRSLTRMREGAQVATDLIDRARAIARPDVLEKRPVQLEDFLENLRPTLEANCPENVRLEIACAAGMAPLETNLSRLRTLLVELVRNASEASPKNGTVRLATGVTAEGQVFIAVRDDGRGVARGLERKIFQPFFTTHAARNAAGLGLSVALSLAQQLEGDLRYERAGKVTTFRLLLPAQAHPARAAAAA